MSLQIKTVFVKSEFKRTYREKVVRRETGKTKKGFLGGTKPETVKEKIRVPDGESDCYIDGDATAISVNDAISDLVNDGFRILSVTPITSGSYRYDYREGSISSSPRVLSEGEAVSGSSGYSYGYGFSYTEGILILAEHTGKA